jgi:hypothetical protein
VRDVRYLERSYVLLLHLDPPFRVADGPPF